MTEVERAERATRSRALLMVVAAIVLAINVLIQWGKPAYQAADVRAASWLVLIGLWVLILATGGGLALRGRMRQLLNDELTLQNRARALAFGFYAAMAAALAAFVLSWYGAVATGDALKLVSGSGVVAALLRFAWLEMRPLL